MSGVHQGIGTRLEELEAFCGSDQLELEGLRERIEGLPSSIIHGSSFFHQACMNKKVTLEMLVCLLYAFPKACSVSSTVFCPEGMAGAGEESYPLHIVCYNQYCSRSMIEVVLERNHSALAISSSLGDGVISGYEDQNFVMGSPLSYYLSRETNIDLGTIQMLVQAAPHDILVEADDDGRMEFLPTLHTAMHFLPLHTALSNPNICESQQYIIEYFLEAAPSSIELADGYNRVALQIACRTETMNTALIQLLLDSYPEAIHNRDICGQLTLHTLCANSQLDDDSWLGIFQLLVNVDPNSVRETDADGCIPLHLAGSYTSSRAVKALVDEYPESVRIATHGGRLPLHEAVGEGRVDTIQYLIDLYPESIHAVDSQGNLPIHCSLRISGRNEIIGLLLKHDPTALTKENDGGYLPLHAVCHSYDMPLDAIQYLYDSFPDAILLRDGNGKTPLELVLERRSQAPDGHSVIAQSLSVEEFLETQQEYARKAQDMSIMNIADDDGRLELHRVFSDSDASLGSIKLLVKGNPVAMDVPDNSGDLPLHHACRSGNFAAIKYLLETNSAPVSKRNGGNMLPIHLLCQTMADSDSIDYIESVWLLLQAHPETLLF